MQGWPEVSKGKGKWYDGRLTIGFFTRDSGWSGDQSKKGGGTLRGEGKKHQLERKDEQHDGMTVKGWMLKKKMNGSEMGFFKE